MCVLCAIYNMDDTLWPAIISAGVSEPKYCRLALDDNNIAVVYAQGNMNIGKFHVFK